MRSQIGKAKWKQMRGRIRERWGKITDNDLDRIEGTMERLVGVLMERYGYGRRRARREVSSIVGSIDEPTDYLWVALGAILGAAIAVLLIVKSDDLYKALA